MVRKLGVAVSNLYPNDLSYWMIKQGNEELKKRSVKDFSLLCFSEEPCKPCLREEFPILEIYEMWGFDGPIISTNLKTTKKLINAPSPSCKIFYVWDIEWFRFQQKRYEQLAEIYQNKELTIIAKSEDYARLIESCWNVKVEGVVERFELNKFWGVIDESEKRRRL